MSILLPTVKLICPINIILKIRLYETNLSDESLFRLPRTRWRWNARNMTGGGPAMRFLLTHKILVKHWHNSKPFKNISYNSRLSLISCWISGSGKTLVSLCNTLISDDCKLTEHHKLYNFILKHREGLSRHSSPGLHSAAVSGGRQLYSQWLVHLKNLLLVTCLGVRDLEHTVCLPWRNWDWRNFYCDPWNGSEAQGHLVNNFTGRTRRCTEAVETPSHQHHMSWRGAGTPPDQHLDSLG